MIEMTRFGYRNGSTIQMCALTDLCGEEFVPGRVVDYPDNPVSVAFYPDGYTIVRESMGEVGRTVERIDHPLVAGWRLLR